MVDSKRCFKIGNFLGTNYGIPHYQVVFKCPYYPFIVIKRITYYKLNSIDSKCRLCKNNKCPVNNPSNYFVVDSRLNFTKELVVIPKLKALLFIAANKDNLGVIIDTPII